MKKLRRSLSILLVFAMVLSLCVGAFAVNETNIEKFKDLDEMDYRYAEALEVLTGLGVIIGDEEENVNPTDPVERDEAAKIVAFLNQGAKAENYPARSIYTDIPKGDWSEKYVAYGTDAGIINGVGDDKFDPDANVTGYELAKMLLVSLGYGQYGEYVGDSWLVNVQKDLKKTSLDYNLDDVDLNNPIERQQVFQMAYNALCESVVESSIAGYVPTDVLLIEDAFKAHLNYEYADEFGNPSYEWKIGTKTVAGPFFVVPEYVTTEPVYAKDLKTLAGGTYEDIYYILNGAYVDDDVDYYGGYGAETRVYLSYDKEMLNRHLRDIPVSIIVVTNVEYLGKVSKDGKTLEIVDKSNNDGYGNGDAYTSGVKLTVPEKIDLAEYAGKYVLTQVYDPYGVIAEKDYDYDMMPISGYDPLEDTFWGTPLLDDLTVMEIAEADGFSGYFKSVKQNADGNYSITIGEDYEDAGESYIQSEAALGYDNAVVSDDHLNNYFWFVDSYGNVIGDVLEAPVIGEYWYINFLEINVTVDGTQYVKAYATNAATGEEAVLDLAYTEKLYKDLGWTDITIQTDLLGKESVTMRFKYFNDGLAGKYRINAFNEAEYIYDRVSEVEVDPATNVAGIVGNFWRVTEGTNGYRLRSINKVLKDKVKLIGVQANLVEIEFQASAPKAEDGYINALTALGYNFSKDVRFYDGATKLTIDGTETPITGEDEFKPADGANSIKCLALVDDKGNAAEVYLLDAAPVPPEEEPVKTPGVLVNLGDGLYVRNGTDAPVKVPDNSTTVGKAGNAVVAGENAKFVEYVGGDAVETYFDITAEKAAELNSRIAPNARVFDENGDKVDAFAACDNVFVFELSGKQDYIKVALVQP